MNESTDEPENRAAALLLAARHHHQPLAELPDDCRPRIRAQAYAVQNLVAAALWADRGGVTGWKTGAPNPEVEPIAAPIGAPLIHASGAILPAGDFHLRGIEGELAYRLGRDLPPVAAGYDRVAVEAAIASIHPAIEIVDARLAAGNTADALSKLADFQINGALIVGEGLVDWRRIEPLRQRAVLRIDGELRADTVGGNPAGDPLRLLTWLANHCAARSKGLRAGDIVTTGSHTGMLFVEAGAAITVEFPGLGMVSVSFS
jgi:2-keto-4-pentenoate hydratase